VIKIIHSISTVVDKIKVNFSFQQSEAQLSYQKNKAISIVCETYPHSFDLFTLELSTASAYVKKL